MRSWQRRVAAVDRRLTLHAETASHPALAPTVQAGADPPAGAALARRVRAEPHDDRLREDVLAGAG